MSGSDPSAAGEPTGRPSSGFLPAPALGADVQDVTVKLSGRAGVLAAIPAMLGFHPTDSLVVACLMGERNRLGPVMRVDLGDARQARQLGEFVGRHADAVVVVVYAGPGIEYDVGPVVRMLAEQVPVVEVLEVGNEPQSSDPVLDAASALRGRRTLTGRDAVVASVAFGGVAKSPPPRLWSNVTERDHMVSEFMKDAEGALSGLIFALTQTADDDPQLADLAAVTAVVAYRCGDGALGQVCLDRALLVDPAHRLSILLMGAFSMGIPPEVLDVLMRVAD